MAEEKPTIAGRAPMGVELDQGTYWWCACGQSSNQPWCDGSHKGTAFTPEKVEVKEKKTYWMCTCKHSNGAPFCDGTHKKV